MSYLFANSTQSLRLVSSWLLHLSAVRQFQCGHSEMWHFGGDPRCDVLSVFWMMQDEDLFTIFSRFGTVTSWVHFFFLHTWFSSWSFSLFLENLLNFYCRADIIRDFKTGDSLCYAFIGECLQLLYVHEYDILSYFAYKIIKLRPLIIDILDMPIACCYLGWEHRIVLPFSASSLVDHPICFSFLFCVLRPKSNWHSPVCELGFLHSYLWPVVFILLLDTHSQLYQLGLDSALMYYSIWHTRESIWPL